MHAGVQAKEWLSLAAAVRRPRHMRWKVIYGDSLSKQGSVESKIERFTLSPDQIKLNYT